MPPTHSTRPATRSLEPNWADRVSLLWQPARGRGVLARRAAAGACVVAAAVLLVRGDPSAEHLSVVVAARDLPSGTVLTATDLRTASLARSAVPDGAVTAVEDTAGRTVAGPIRAGEALTDVRVLGPRLAAAAVGSDDARIVPLELADAAVADVLREGDVVDVLAVAQGAGGDRSGTLPDPAATLLASGAVVVLVNRPEGDRGGRERLVLLALPREKAHAVAVTSLTHAVTVTVQ
ncbi:flagellar biosynthesis protein FlgA [Rhodococcus triatomae]|uniref:Flp pilus assembly protein CpaB n=1 Tax=Rhodococcus triatomae TaxID=300028 RepID=A0A1G8A9M8_9NOCA|nr:SAF domain-containing protein [Rhodococcus triatomae]QNG17825.1 flagellar biosynthesis protein FlgA [Rhodococcus triatomae]QNG22507.1 flagellar biosynthesis protein FlgA [Rhodococcus triatomae]SDH17638.1 Flp pilus assembly protein CpaB [Rhodococcus triatomae]